MRKITASKAEDLFFKDQIYYLFSVGNKAVFAKDVHAEGETKVNEFVYIEVN